MHDVLLFVRLATIEDSLLASWEGVFRPGKRQEEVVRSFSCLKSFSLSPFIRPAVLLMMMMIDRPFALFLRCVQE
jgi:hypothetical protein